MIHSNFGNRYSYSLLFPSISLIPQLAKLKQVINSSQAPKVPIHLVFIGADLLRTKLAAYASLAISTKSPPRDDETLSAQIKKLYWSPYEGDMNYDGVVQYIRTMFINGVKDNQRRESLRCHTINAINHDDVVNMMHQVVVSVSPVT
jgi:hypothetical protein